MQAYLSKIVARLWEKEHFHMRRLDCSKYSHSYKCSETTVNSDIFARILFSRIRGIKRHICDVENSRLGHDLHQKMTVISPFREGFIFVKLQSFVKTRPSRKFLNLQ